MADPGLQPVRLERVGNIDAQPVRRLGLADAGYIVVLAFDGHQGDVPDLRGIHDIVAVVHGPCGRAWRTNTVSTVWR